MTSHKDHTYHLDRLDKLRMWNQTAIKPDTMVKILNEMEKQKVKNNKYDLKGICKNYDVPVSAVQKAVVELRKARKSGYKTVHEYFNAGREFCLAKQSAASFYENKNVKSKSKR